MSFQERLIAVWTYGRGAFCAVLAGAGILLLLVHAYAGESKEEILNGILVNQYLDSAVVEEFEKEALAAVLGNPQTQEVFLDAAITLKLAAQDKDTLDNLAKITTYIFGKELDYMIVEPEVADHFWKLNGLEAVQEYLPLDSYTSMTDRFYYGNGKQAYGIRLADTEFVKHYGITLENPVICVVHNSKRKEKAAQLICWLLS